MSYDDWVLQITAWTSDDRLEALTGYQIEALAAYLSARDTERGLTTDAPEVGQPCPYCYEGIRTTDGFVSMLCAACKGTGEAA